MKAIVAGGTGFLGSHLCEYLLNKGYEVLCIDNLITSTGLNITHLEDNPKFRFLRYDISNKLPEEMTADEIYHLASPASPNIHSPKSYHALAFETMQANTVGTWNLAELASINKAKFLFASTSEIYGDPLEHPQKESYRGNVSTTGPRAVYDEAKRFGETITSAYIRSKSLDGRIIRIFNTYGPNMALDDGRVVTEFIKASIANQPLPIFGNGTQTRSFCYVSDLIEGIFLAMQKQNTKGEVINLGNPNEFTILELADLIIKLTKATSKEIKEKLPEDDPLQRCPDISKAKNLLGWEPQVELEEGLKKTIEFFSAS
ncbi:MAG: GDP-mannose 4,6-dehydratase [Candidatus Daviesbacteria bacterium]|nr:GDP-mannose 4,6-dehydratase [Candidatus Daviesbacteria bacterium]